MSRLDDMFTKGIDGRSAKGRLYKQHYDAIVELLGGKVDVVTEDLVRRTAATMVINEQFDRDLIEGKDIDQDEFNRSTNTYRGLCRELGLLPQQASNTPTTTTEITKANVKPLGEDGRYTAKQIYEIEGPRPGDELERLGPSNEGAAYYTDDKGVVRDLNDDCMDDLVDYEAINGRPGSYDNA